LKLVDAMQDAVISVSGDIGSASINGNMLGSAIRSDGTIGFFENRRRSRRDVNQWRNNQCARRAFSRRRWPKRLPSRH
jgi:hypothetical protein